MKIRPNKVAFRRKVAKPPAKEPFRNLTPPQHLRQGQIQSAREIEVSAMDPAWQELVALRTEVRALRAEVARLKTLLHRSTT